jgi:hypothetical protein
VKLSPSQYLGIYYSLRANGNSADASEVFLTVIIASWSSSNASLEITRRIDEAKRKMGRVMQIAAFSLAEVTYAVGGDIGYQVQESAKSARFRVRTKQENVSGVFLPAFESYITEGNNDFGLTGLGKGGQQVQRCRETYARAVETLVELASLQTAFVILDEVIKVVNRRGELPSFCRGSFANMQCSERY